ncbi:hypothetical protein A3G62_02405 [Candidatus Kaiserbacteria bacterium RIFCSPLOWO2_12_FULL_50_10]|nr:MAG: hypothetical protein A3G62_02405 [Candidatus Kaiserbacteria bacterium RIFCSPLOWO2_12_FULL_50_10]
MKKSFVDGLKEMLHIETALPRDVVVGVDFGGSTLKVVQLSKKQAIPTLDTYGEVALAPYQGGPEGKVVTLNIDAHTKALRDVVRDAGVVAQSAAITLPYGATFTVVLTIDSVDPTEITARIPVQIKNLIPVRLQDVTIDWFPFAHDEAAQKTTVMAVAVHNHTLAQLREVVTRAGFSILSTELEFFSTIRVAAHGDKAFVVLDLGATSGKVYFVHGGKLVGVHSIASLGGEGVTRRIAAAMGVAFDAAEAKKRDGAVPVPDEILTQAAREVSSLITSHTHAAALAAAPCIVVGGGARVRDLSTAFGAALARTVELGEPFHHVAYPQILKDTLTRMGGAYAPSLSVAYAAVMTK